MVAAITSLFLCLAVQRFRLRAVAQYDGRRFHGVQKNVRTQDGAPLRTVLLTLEQALWPALGRQVKIGVAGRTDAGVSAEGQVIIFDADTLDGEAACVSVDGSAVRVPDLAGALNAHLPADLQLKRVDVVPSRFDVVRCRWKRYRYRLPSTRPRDDEERRVLKLVATHAARAERQRREEGLDPEQAGLPPPRSRKQRRREAAQQPLHISDVGAMQAAASLLCGTRRSTYPCIPAGTRRITCSAEIPFHPHLLLFVLF